MKNRIRTVSLIIESTSHRVDCISKEAPCGSRYLIFQGSASGIWGPSSRKMNFCITETKEIESDDIGYIDPEDGEEYLFAEAFPNEEGFMHLVEIARDQLVLAETKLVLTANVSAEDKCFQTSDICDWDGNEGLPIRAISLSSSIRTRPN